MRGLILPTSWIPCCESAWIILASLASATASMQFSVSYTFDNIGVKREGNQRNMQARRGCAEMTMTAYRSDNGLVRPFAPFAASGSGTQVPTVSEAMGSSVNLTQWYSKLVIHRDRFRVVCTGL
ncbi:hypothetical protein F4680DRAFT_194217 [Xylaria scruposa]|nr:hypothetical protein F4680DRAFT_194217 [Xylaria scruposa]